MNEESPNPYQPPVEGVAPPPLERVPFSGKRLAIGIALLAVMWWSLWAAVTWNPRWVLVSVVAGFATRHAIDPSLWKSVLSDRSPQAILTSAVSVVGAISVLAVFYILLPTMKAHHVPWFLKRPDVVVGLWVVSCLWMAMRWWKRRSKPPYQPAASDRS